MKLSLAENSIPENIVSDKEALKNIIKEKSLIVKPKGEYFILASGEQSNIFLDVKMTLLDPRGSDLTGKLILEKIGGDITAIGGLELGACPAVSNACVIAGQRGLNTKFFYVRKAKKGRGTNQLVEGCKVSENDKVVLVDDVTTKGGSVKEAIKVVQDAGAKVVKVLSIVDRQEGARENLAKDGIELDSLFTKDELLES